MTQTHPASTFSRFDRLVVLVIGLLLLAIGALSWRAWQLRPVAAAPLLPAALFTTLDEDNREQLHTVPLTLDPPGSPTDAVTKLTADPGGIWDFTASPDGRTLASGDEEEMKLWSIATGQEILTVPRGSIAIQFQKNGRRLLRVDNSDRLVLFDVDPQ